MFRVVAKVPVEGLPWKYKNGTSRLHKAIRYYSKKDLCPPPPNKGSGSIYTIGALTLVGGATLGYAKYDPDFRSWLTETVPFTDSVIKFIFQEEKSFIRTILDALENLKDSLLELIGVGSGKSKIKDIPLTPKDYNPPSPILPSLEKQSKKDESYTEIRIEEKQQGSSEPKVSVGGDLKVNEGEFPDTHPKNLVDLEMKICEKTKAAVEAYNKAVNALKNYNQDVQIVVEDSVEQLDPGIWASLERKTAAKNSAIKEAETNAAEATECINKLKELISKKSFDAPALTKEQVKSNIVKVQDDIAKAKKELDNEKKLSDVTEKYWHKVEKARKHFAKELETLFPTVKIDEKKMKLNEGEIDLFVLHTYSNILFYQKELAKLETLTDARLRGVIEAARRGKNEVLTDAQVSQQVEKERRNIQMCYQQQCLKLRNESEKDLRCQLKLQSEAFSDHLADALRVREMEVERQFLRKFDEELEKERCKFKIQLSAMIGRLRGMDQALKARVEADKTSKQAQVLWSACLALFRAVKAGCPGVPWQEQLRPLDPEITAVKKASAEGDELVKAVISGIPKEAKERGVYPEDALRERFLKVEKVARQVALVPEGGARLPIFILSYIQSMLLVNAASPIPQAELNDEVVNFSTLSTNDILQRARYWLDRGDFAQTLRYMNLLKGAPRSVASEWMNEARILLETQQAAHTLMAHAASSGLSYL